MERKTKVIYSAKFSYFKICLPNTFLCFQRLKALEDSESSGQPEIPPPSYREALRLNIKAKHQMPKVENS